MSTKFVLTLATKSQDIARTGILTTSEREIPYLPPEIIENITRLLIEDFPSCKNCMYNEQCEERIYDNETTLLNLFCVFPYLLNQIKNKFCSHKLPLHIYNFIYMQIDNVLDKLVILVENFKDVYNLDTWLAFITCEHSPFYTTDEGIAFVNYILNKYSNHQKKKIKNTLLCNLLTYHSIIPISKNLDNIIFNKFVYHFKNTKKINFSLLTIEEKHLLLSYISFKCNDIVYSTYELYNFIKSVLNIRSTRIIDILKENIILPHLHEVNVSSLLDYIMKYYTHNNYDTYSLGLIIKYYLSAVLQTYSLSIYYTKNLCNNLYKDLTDAYKSVISPILYEAIITKNIYLIELIFDMKESTKSNLFKVISSDSLYNKIEHFTFILECILHYNKYTFNFNDVSLFDWCHNNDTVHKYLLLYKIAIKNIDHIHNLDTNLLVQIYNYMVYQYNSRSLDLIFNKTYHFRDYNYNPISNYSTSIVDKLNVLQIKNDIDTLCQYIYTFYNLTKKCNHIMTLIDIKCSNTNCTLTYIKKYNRRILYISNVYNFILKHKLYMTTNFHISIKKKSIHILEEIKTHKFNKINTINDNYKNTNKNKILVDNILTLQKIIIKLESIVNATESWGICLAQIS